MYASPILLPQFSNREDLLLPVSIFDDDTGQPINLSGTTGSGTTVLPQPVSARGTVQRVTATRMSSPRRKATTWSPAWPLASTGT